MHLDAEAFKRNATDTDKTSSAFDNATDADIQTMAEECMDYVELMQSDCPHECYWVVNIEWVQNNLFELPT